MTTKERRNQRRKEQRVNNIIRKTIGCTFVLIGLAFLFIPELRVPYTNYDITGIMSLIFGAFCIMV